MLPLWLYLENFGSYRSPTTVDFTGVDYFALVGPTGAGKSTVIDGVCFALYGTVPRWGREKAISLALPPGATVGRVAMVFEAGERRYGVVRVLARDRAGRVTTREARLDELDAGLPAGSGLDPLLESVLRPLAEGEDVTAAAQEITGLPYRYFVRSVVVPQGRFAEFLHAPPRERQDLLVRLLDAGAYERVRRAAAAEEDAARQAADLARRQLAALADADEAAERRARTRLETWRELAGAVRASLDDLAGYDDELKDARAELAAATEQLAALLALTPPEGVAELAERIAAGEAAVTRLAAAAAAAEDEEAAAAAELAEAGDAAAIERTRDRAREHDRLVAELAATRDKLAERSERAGELAASLERADAAGAEAAAELARAKDADAAAALAARLAPGHPCPVCLRPVEERPHHEAGADLAEIEAWAAERAREVARLEGRHRSAEVALAALRQSADDLGDRVERIAAELAEAPALPDIEERLKRIAEAGRRAEGAAATARSARRARDEAAGHAAALRREAERTWHSLDEARDRVAALRPPVPRRDDPAVAWRTLLDWRDDTAARQRDEVAALAEGVEWTEQAAGELRATVTERLAAAGLEVAADATAVAVGIAVTEAVTNAGAALERVRERRAMAAELTARARDLDHHKRVAHELALLLRANNFEKWLCGEAMGLLVEDASGILRELSGGQYEMALGPRDEIEIVDYWEAGRTRSARTLSGGETFQAGLALALALSEQVSGFASAAARSLDAIFLDEGFGALDGAALDSVAATLERLAAGAERMVGVVTHVPALAERVPVRYEVARDAGGSRVRRVLP